MRELRKLFKSFRYAFQGLIVASKERNFLIQLVVGATAIVFAIILRLTSIEKIVVVLFTALVLASEAMNSAIERLLDFVSQERIEEIREIKDLMAAAVLILSFAALFVGIWIFGNALFHR